MDQREQHNKATHRFIDLANEMKDEGLPTELVSAALMSASGIYATYVAAGESNDGVLQTSGVNKVAEMYHQTLTHIQDRKRQEIEQRTGQTPD